MFKRGFATRHALRSWRLATSTWGNSQWVLLVLGLLLPGYRAAAQRLSITGQVVPFACVFVPHTAIGTMSDQNSRFQLTVPTTTDSLAVSSLVWGFLTQRKCLAGPGAAVPTGKGLLNTERSRGLARRKPGVPYSARSTAAQKPKRPYRAYLGRLHLAELPSKY